MSQGKTRGRNQKMKKNPALALTMAVAFGIGAQFVQFPSFAQGTPTLGMQSAEAGMFDSLGDSLAKAKDNIVKKTKSAAHDRVQKLMNVDVEGMSNRKQRALWYLAMSAGYENSSALHLAHVVGMDPAKTKALNDAVYSFNTDRGAFTHNFANAKAFSVIAGPSEEEWKAKTESLIKSNPQGAELEKLQGQMRTANKERKVAAIFNSMAAAETANILKDSAKALAHSGDLGDKLQTVQDLASFAKEANHILSVQREASKTRSASAKSLSRALHVPEQNKEAKAEADTIKMDM